MAHRTAELGDVPDTVAVLQFTIMSAGSLEDQDPILRVLLDIEGALMADRRAIPLGDPVSNKWLLRVLFRIEQWPIVHEDEWLDDWRAVTIPQYQMDTPQAFGWLLAEDVAKKPAQAETFVLTE